MSVQKEINVIVKSKEGSRFSITVDYPTLGGKVEEETLSPLERFNSRLEKISNKWVSNSLSFFEVVPELNNLPLHLADYQVEEKALGLLSELSSKSETREEDGITVEEFSLPIHEAPRVTKSIELATRIAQTTELMRRAALGALLAEYEGLVGELISAIADFKPEILGPAAHEVSLEDISELSSLSELKRFIVEQKVDAVLFRKPHKEVLKWLEERVGVNLSSNRALISEFVEVCQRRHLISHSGGRANARYVKICEDEGCPSEMILKKDQLANVDRVYLRRATARVFQVGFFTLHLVWQKLVDGPEYSDRSLLEASHSFLEYDLTKMARRVCEFALSRKANAPTGMSKASFLMNLAQAHKFDPMAEPEARAAGVRNVLEKED